MDDKSIIRRLPVGAELQPHGGVHFRVWTPKVQTVSVIVQSGQQPSSEMKLNLETGALTGVFSGFRKKRGRVDTVPLSIGERRDAFSRPSLEVFQPNGPNGPCSGD